MKNVILLLSLSMLAINCKKDEKIADTAKNEAIVTIDSASKRSDSVTVTNRQVTAPRVNPLDEGAELGKAIFTQNGLVMIAFNTQNQTGKIVIDGKEYALSKFTFAENGYEITGNGVKITAENGDFKEMTSDCAYGNFPTVKITLNQQEINLENISVQDCPAY